MIQLIKEIGRPLKKLSQPIRSARPDYSKLATPGVHTGTCFQPQTGKSAWYPLPMIGADTIAEQAMNTSTLRDTLTLLKSLSPDEFIEYLIGLFEKGLNSYGDSWRYADIGTVVLASARIIRPSTYLEIGVRRGRSVCALASQVPSCSLLLFDKWVENYAGMDNPGPKFVQCELARIGHTGKVEFISGNSHTTVPQYFAANPTATFDMITVDGDHSEHGAAQDLSDVMPYLSIGGVLVFDDICHPKHLGLRSVWNELVVSDRRYSTWSYDMVGFGVAIAIRKW